MHCPFNAIDFEHWFNDCVGQYQCIKDVLDFHLQEMRHISPKLNFTGGAKEDLQDFTVVTSSALSVAVKMCIKA